jgi:hypothetical protein
VRQNNSPPKLKINNKRFDEDDIQTQVKIKAEKTIGNRASFTAKNKRR